MEECLPSLIDVREVTDGSDIICCKCEDSREGFFGEAFDVWVVVFEGFLGEASGGGGGSLR